MPRHLISDAHEWINEIPTAPIYYLAKPGLPFHNTSPIFLQPFWFRLRSMFLNLSPPAVVGFRPHLSEPSSLALWDNGTMPLNPRPFSAQGVPPAVVGSRVYTMADIKIIADRQCKDPVGVQSTR